MICIKMQRDLNRNFIISSGASWINRLPRSLALRLLLTTAMLLSISCMATTYGLSTPVPVVEALSQPVTEDSAATGPIPVLAYYYIWFDVKSWDRAKTDYPLLGRYSSDDADVMRQHIRWAKQAGIEIIGDTEVFAREVQGSGAKIVAITGN